MLNNVKSRLFDVIKEQSFCDVTLVSDDHKPFQAHRYVLSIFSQSSLEKYSPQQSPLTPTDLPKGCKSPRAGLNLTVYLSWQSFSEAQKYYQICSGC